MKARAETIKHVFLELTEKEAKLIRDLCQNPSEWLESEEQEIMRSIFNGIKEALNGTANEEDVFVIE